MGLHGVETMVWMAGEMKVPEPDYSRIVTKTFHVTGFWRRKVLAALDKCGVHEGARHPWALELIAQRPFDIKRIGLRSWRVEVTYALGT